MVHAQLALPLACLMAAGWVIDSRAQDAPKPVTFDDLRNATIEAKVVYAQTVRRHSDDRIFNNQNHTDIS